jgi:hypothetical protein
VLKILNLQLLSFGPLCEVTVEEEEERLHLGIECLCDVQVPSVPSIDSEPQRLNLGKDIVPLTLLKLASLIAWTKELRSFLMALAATPVVALLKSW